MQLQNTVLHCSIQSLEYAAAFMYHQVATKKHQRNNVDVKVKRLYDDRGGSHLVSQLV